jgi:hypothetical protein
MPSPLIARPISPPAFESPPAILPRPFIAVPRSGIPPTDAPLNAEPMDPLRRPTVFSKSAIPELIPPPKPPPNELVTELTALLAEDITDVNGLSDKDIKRLRLDYLLLEKCAIII